MWFSGFIMVLNGLYIYIYIIYYMYIYNMYIWFHIVSYGFIWILYQSTVQKRPQNYMESLAPWVKIEPES